VPRVRHEAAAPRPHSHREMRDQGAPAGRRSDLLSLERLLSRAPSSGRRSPSGRSGGGRRGGGGRRRRRGPRRVLLRGRAARGATLARGAAARCRGEGGTRGAGAPPQSGRGEGEGCCSSGSGSISPRPLADARRCGRRTRAWSGPRRSGGPRRRRCRLRTASSIVRASNRKPRASLRLCPPLPRSATRGAASRRMAPCSVTPRTRGMRRRAAAVAPRPRAAAAAARTAARTVATAAAAAAGSVQAAISLWAPPRARERERRAR